MDKTIVGAEKSPIFTRRSVRKYVDRQIEKEKMERILRAAMQAPSSGNQQPWEFLVVEDKETLRKVSEASKYVQFVDKAGDVILVMSNDEFLKYDGGYWQQDLSAATQNILLQAVIEGLGGVWMGVAPDEEMMNYLADLFQLTEGITPFSLVSMGYMESEEDNRYVDRFNESRVHHEKWTK
jgi:nitroreductase